MYFSGIFGCGWDNKSNNPLQELFLLMTIRNDVLLSLAISMSFGMKKREKQKNINQFNNIMHGT
jgi:hypothetical protein